MEQGIVFLAMFTGIFLRLGVPILVTVVIILWLRKLDERWQADGKRYNRHSIQLAGMARNPGCWDLKGCSVNSRDKCAAYSLPETPCWQLFRDNNGRLREGCIDCQIFREAPVPAF